MNIHHTLASRSAILAILVSAFASFAAGPMAQGATFTWDSGGSSAGNPADGSGTWSTSNPDWSNGSADADWNNSDLNDNAVIGDANGAAGTITVGTISVGNITFNPPGSGSYTLNGGSITLTSGTITTNAASATISSVLAGSVGLTTAGTGTLTLSTAETYTGATTVTNGTLLLQTAANTTLLQASSNIVITGGTMELNDSAGNNLLNGNAVTVGVGGTMLNAGNAAILGAVTLTGGVITGSNTEATYGSYYFNGAVNVSGGTQSTISAHTFDPNGQTFTVSNGSTLLLTGSSLAADNSMTINAGGTLQIGNGTTDGFWTGNIADSGTLAYDIVGTQAYTSNISGTGALTKAGAGTLALQASGQDVASAVSIVITGGTIELNDTTGNNIISGNAVTVGAGGTLLNIGDAVSLGTVTLTGGVLSGSNSEATYGSYYFQGAVNVSGSTQSTISAHTFNPGGQTFTVSNGSTLLLTGSSLAADNSMTINAGGTLQIGNGTTDGYWAGNIADNGTLAYDIIGTQVYGLNYVISGTGALTKAGAGTWVLYATGQAVASAVSIVITGGAIELNDTNGNNVISGNAVTVGTGGTMLNVGDAVTLGTVTLTGGVLSGSNSEATYGSYLFSGPVNISGSTQSTISAYAINPNGQTFTVANGSTLLVTSQMLTGGGNAGNFTMAGGGTMVLTGSTTSGATMTIGAGGTVQIGNGTTNGFWSGAITDNGTLALVGPNAQTYAGGAISGTGTLTILGPGPQTFTTDVLGATPSISTLAIGTGATLNLDYAGNNQLPASASSTISISGTLDVGTASANTIRGPTITLNNGTMTSTGGPVATYGAYLVGNPLTITASGAANTISGNGNMGLGATLTLNTPQAADALTVSTILGVSGNTVGGLTKSGSGTVTLTAADIYTGATTINAGTLQLGNGGTTGSIASSSGVTGSSGATLAFDQSGSVAWSMATSGSLGVTQAGIGTLTLSTASLTYTGPTTATSGTLIIASTATALGGGIVANGGTLVANNSVAGSGTASAGTLIVAGGLSGSVAANGGTLIANSTIGGGGSVSGGILGGRGTITGNVTVGTGLGGPSSSVIEPSVDGAVVGNTPDATVLTTSSNLTLNSDAAYKFTLNSGQIGFTDELVVKGTLTLNGASTLIGFDAGNSLLTTNGNAQYVIADAFNGISGFFGNAGNNSIINIGQNYFDVSYTSDGFGGEEILLTAAAIPEPGTWATILGGLGLLCAYRRRRSGLK